MTAPKLQFSKGTKAGRHWQNACLPLYSQNDLKSKYLARELQKINYKFRMSSFFTHFQTLFSKSKFRIRMKQKRNVHQNVKTCVFLIYEDNVQTSFVFHFCHSWNYFAIKYVQSVAFSYIGSPYIHSNIEFLQKRGDVFSYNVELLLTSHLALPMVKFLLDLEWMTKEWTN